MATAINEEMHVEKEWFKEAKEQTVETLPQFINHLMNDYRHDYGTICHALSAAALAAVYAADKSPQGGITGFQASFIMWDFIKQWMYPHNECGLRLIDYDDMLFPQYQDKFEKIISPDTWNKIQEQARKYAGENDIVHSNVLAHWKSIINGEIPFGYILSRRTDNV